MRWAVSTHLLVMVSWPYGRRKSASGISPQYARTLTATADTAVLPGVFGCSFDRLRTSSPWRRTETYTSMLSPYGRYRRFSSPLCCLNTARDIAVKRGRSDPVPMSVLGELIHVHAIGFPAVHQSETMGQNHRPSRRNGGNFNRNFSP
jgi:hypothetical protein